MYDEPPGYVWEDGTILWRQIRGKFQEVLRSGCIDSHSELELYSRKIQIGDVFWSNLFGGHCGCSHLLSLYVFTGYWNLSLLHLGALGWLKPSSSSTTKMVLGKEHLLPVKPQWSIARWAKVSSTKSKLFVSLSVRNAFHMSECDSSPTAVGCIMSWRLAVCRMSRAQASLSYSWPQVTSNKA